MLLIPLRARWLLRSRSRAARYKVSEILERPKDERPYLLLVAGFPTQDATVPDIGRYGLKDIATFVE